MSFTWNPGLWRTGQSFLPLPQPIFQVVVEDSWNRQDHEVPYLAGGVSYAPSMKPVKITIVGNIAVSNGTQKITEQEMYETWTAVRDYLAGVPDGTGMEFFLIYDSSGGGTYRKFKKVFPESFEVDSGDTERTNWPYKLVLKANDVTIYSTAGGS
ncbi:MAG: hypothetical protein E6Q97_39585 [Desulfurellales bacterium]|nr:MAG: hypothetical protein E6Q97_39585 [Desulfurellales bacterium]